MTSSAVVGIVVYAFLGLVVLALVVYAILVLLVGRTDLAQWDQSGQPVLDRTDRRYWKSGFYMNPRDPALWVPKRHQNLGVTVNLGHPKGRLVAASLLLVPALLIFVVGAVAWLAVH